MHPWEQSILADLDRLEKSDLFRTRQVTRPIDATHVHRAGRELVNFASNNYLGLTHHPRIIKAARSTEQEYGTGSGAAPLIAGYGPAHAAAERAIAQWKGTESALLLSSGYQANHAAIQTAAAIGGLQGNDGSAVAGGARFLLDRLAHASLVDAIRATGEPLRVFPHNHIPKLRRLLEDHDPEQLQVVVTESIFSMDGDAADLRSIVDLKREHPFLLILDEAHASGVYGPAGCGLAAELGLGSAVDVSILTLSKALGGIGGVVCSSDLFCKAVVNYGRAYLFSTSVPPSVAATAEAAIDVLRIEPDRQRRLRTIATGVRGRIAELGFDVPAGDSPIIPIILGGAGATLAAAQKLLEAGLLVVAVRPPTVPRGSSRLRIALSSQHTEAEIELLLKSLEQLRSHLEVSR